MVLRTEAILMFIIAYLALNDNDVWKMVEKKILGLLMEELGLGGSLLPPLNPL